MRARCTETRVPPHAKRPSPRQPCTIYEVEPRNYAWPRILRTQRFSNAPYQLGWLIRPLWPPQPWQVGRLSWKETAEAFRTSCEKVFDAVEHVITWGLEHRALGQIDAIGVDEIQYSKGHKYLTLVYQIDLGVTRLLWIGKERRIESFQGFFTTVGEEITSKIAFICSDMWEPYLKVIREKCSEALHILDRFHIVAKMNKAVDEVRAGESRRMASFRTYRVLELSLYHSLGKLPEPECTHDFF